MRHDISKEMRFGDDGRCVSEGMRSDLVVPVVAREKVIGVFNFTSRELDFYTSGHLETAKTVADGLATVAPLFGTNLSQASLEELVARRTAELEEANKKLKEEITQRTHAEEGLRDSERLLRSTMEATDDGILVVGNDDRASMSIRCCSKTGECSIGYPGR